MDTDEPTGANREIPPALAAAFQTAFDLDDRPTTLGDWGDAMAGFSDESGFSIGADALCAVESSRHEARIDGEMRYFNCVLDALLVPYVVDVSGSVEVRSRSPVSDRTVEMTVTRDSLTFEPVGAVASLGIEPGITPVEDAERIPAVAYRAFCPYANAFPDRTEYERWREETPEAETMAVPMAEAHELAGFFGQRVTE